MIESICFRPSIRKREAGVFNNLHSEGPFRKPAFLVLERGNQWWPREMSAVFFWLLNITWSPELSEKNLQFIFA